MHPRQYTPRDLRDVPQNCPLIRAADKGIELYKDYPVAQTIFTQGFRLNPYDIPRDYREFQKELIVAATIRGCVNVEQHEKDSIEVVCRQIWLDVDKNVHRFVDVFKAAVMFCREKPVDIFK